MRGEKVLVFTAFVAVLDVIEQFMKEINNQDSNPKAMLYGYDQYRTTWVEGKDYLRLDGKTPREYRHKMINEFNRTENQRLRCFLISAKAGGQGINLIGANRCVLIDTSWNPSSDQQNIFRIFRLGQKKPCYVYRLVALGTMEEKIYSRSVTKQAMSGRVVDKMIIDRHYRGDELEQLYEFTEYDPKHRETPVMPRDDVLKFLLSNYQQQIFKYHEHDSLLENKPEQDLSEAEKQEAWDLYENEQRAQANRMNPMLGNIFPQQPFGGSALDLNGFDMMNLNNMLNQYPQYNNFPSTSTGATGFDFNALSKSYFPSLTSGIYSNEFYKKLYEPMTMYAAAQSSLPLPPVSTITSSSSTALPTVSTNSNSLMTSLLRSPLAPPNVPPAHSLSSIPTTYNANSIPLAPKSMFSAKLSPSNPTSISSSSVNTTTAPSISAAPSKQNVQIPSNRSLVKQNTPKRPNLQMNQLSQALNKMTQAKRPDHSSSKGSSSALSILPDGDVRRPVSNGNQLKTADKSKSASMNSLNSQQLSAARTNAPYIRGTDIRKTVTVGEQLKNTVTVQPKILARGNSTGTLVARPQVSRPVQKKTNNMNQNKGVTYNPRLNQEFLRKVQSQTPLNALQRPLNAQQRSLNAQQRPLNAQQRPSNAQQQQPQRQVSGIFPKKTSIDPAIQKQLEKNQTSMTEATRPLQITSTVGKNTENSVSIIALKPNTSGPSPVRVQKQNTADIAITPLMSPPAQAKKAPIQIMPPKVITRPIGPSTSGNKVVISPQYLQGIKRTANVSLGLKFLY